MDQLQEAGRERTARTSTSRNILQRSSFRLVCVFWGTYLVFFLASNRVVNIYDEGILLTAVMRTMAGQVLHRDFYYNYGPAQLYILAGLFKLFGSSVLVERLTALSASAFLGTTIYALARKFCTELVSFGALLLAILWMIGENLMQSFLISSVCALLLWSTYLTLRKPGAALSRRRVFAAGLLVGILTTFRYDMGFFVAASHVVTLTVALWLDPEERSSRLRSIALQVCCYLAGFAAIVIPVIGAYAAVAPMHDLLYDIVLYTARYYRAGRALPPPSFTWGPQFSDTVVYILPILVCMALYVAIRRIVNEKRSRSNARVPEWVDFLLALAVVAGFLATKGLIRISAGAMYACLIPCVVLSAMLYERRSILLTPLRVLLLFVVGFFFVTGLVSARKAFLQERSMSASTLKWLVAPGKQAPRPPFRSWCRMKTTITKGFCFVLDDDHIQTVEYLLAHTSPADTLYVGLPHHDRIFINDNITYFATQRLPATKWSHFDPFLQNREDIQREMIGELERNRPPYVVLDSEFDQAHEPNGSSVSTGVHLLDDYIAAHYTLVQRFGEMTVLKRQG